MKTITISVLLILFACGNVLAQDTDNGGGQIYLFGAPGAYRYGSGTSFHGGGGIEGITPEGLGFGFEVGGLQLSGSETLASLSGLVSYHFLNVTASRKVVPFLSGGFSVIGHYEGATGAGVLGGGMDYWFNNRSAFRTGYRVQIFNKEEVVHQFLVGVVFRF